MGGFAPLRIGIKQLAWCYSFNLGAFVRTEASSMALAGVAQRAKGQPNYLVISKATGFKGYNAWFLGNQATGVRGLAHCTTHRFMVPGWFHVSKITQKLVRDALWKKLPKASRDLIVERQARYHGIVAFNYILHAPLSPPALSHPRCHARTFALALSHALALALLLSRPHTSTLALARS
jgi:hypothetical protein